MKKSKLLILAVLALALIVAVGSVSFLGPCVHEDGSFGTCHWAGQGMLGIGLLLAAESLIALLCKDAKMRMGLMLAAALTAILGLFIPGTLIGLCRMATMRCRAVMKPAMTILCALAAVLSGISVFAENKKAGTK